MSSADRPGPTERRPSGSGRTARVGRAAPRSALACPADAPRRPGGWPRRRGRLRLPALRVRRRRGRLRPRLFPARQPRPSGGLSRLRLRGAGRAEGRHAPPRSDRRLRHHRHAAPSRQSGRGPPAVPRRARHRGRGRDRGLLYGLLASRLRVSDDVSRVDVRLDGCARRHDGRPVTADDVAFAFETLKADGAPFYRRTFRPLSLVDEGDRAVSIVSERADDRDPVRRLATIPIHPAHHWLGRARQEARGAPLGSGPYRLLLAEAPHRIVVERGRVGGPSTSRPPAGGGTSTGSTSPLTATRRSRSRPSAPGTTTSPSRTPPRAGAPPARVRPSPPARSGRTCEGAEAGTLHGLVLNLRRPVLADRRVRLALALAHDFDAANRTLFSGGHLRFASVFGDTALAARGEGDAGERGILAAADIDPGDAMLADPDPLAGFPAPGTRDALAATSRLLDEAGWRSRAARGSIRRPVLRSRSGWCRRTRSTTARSAGSTGPRGASGSRSSGCRPTPRPAARAADDDALPAEARREAVVAPAPGPSGEAAPSTVTADETSGAAASATAAVAPEPTADFALAGRGARRGGAFPSPSAPRSTSRPTGSTRWSGSPRDRTPQSRRSATARLTAHPDREAARRPPPAPPSPGRQRPARLPSVGRSVSPP